MYRWSGLLVASLMFLSLPAFAYTSGSDGSEGDLILNGDQPNVEIPLPPDGVLHYGEIFIAVGVTVTFTPNADNTPAVLLATGDVVIDGIIDVSGQPSFLCDLNPPFGDKEFCGGAGGPGGFRAADGGMYGQGPSSDSGIKEELWDPFPCNAGPLPGDTAGGAYCTPWSILLAGGGGGGWTEHMLDKNTDLPITGGGGGAITIASSGSITLNGSILAHGGAAAASGGMIRLVANTLDGNGRAWANNESMGDSKTWTNKFRGTIRFEAYAHLGSLLSNTDKNGANSLYIGQPQVAVPYEPGKRPRIFISNIDGNLVTGTGTFPANVTLAQEKEITVEVTTHYVPVGTVLRVAYRPDYNAQKWNLSQILTPYPNKNMLAAAHEANKTNEVAVTGSFEHGVTTTQFVINEEHEHGYFQAWVLELPIP